MRGKKVAGFDFHAVAGACEEKAVNRLQGWFVFFLHIIDVLRLFFCKPHRSLGFCADKVVMPGHILGDTGREMCVVFLVFDEVFEVFRCHLFFFQRGADYGVLDVNEFAVGRGKVACEGGFLQVDFVDADIGLSEDGEGDIGEEILHFDAEFGVVGVCVDIDIFDAGLGDHFCAVRAGQVRDVEGGVFCGRCGEKCGDFGMDGCAGVAEFFIVSDGLCECVGPEIGACGFCVVSDEKGADFVCVVRALGFYVPRLFNVCEMVCHGLNSNQSVGESLQ